MFKSERALGRRDGPGGALVALGGHAQRTGERLEHRLALVVGVVAAQVVDVQRHLGVIDEALEKLVHQVDIELADQGARELDVVFEPGPAGEVDHHARQRLVERHVGVAEAAYARLVADRLGERLAERDADVLDGMVAVDVQVALGFDLEVDHGVARNLVEHVLEERQAGRELGRAFAVQVELHPDLGFFGISSDFSGSHDSASRKAVSSIRFSSGVPTVMRMHWAMPGCRFFTSTPCFLSEASTRAASGTRTRKKFAAEGNTVTPASARSDLPSASRSDRMRAACSSSTSRRSSMNAAAAWVSTFTL